MYYNWFGLVWYHAISTFVDYLTPNTLHTYITNMIWKHISLITFLTELKYTVKWFQVMLCIQ